jgi:hypothetical protein
MRSDARECILDMLGEKHLIKGISDSLTRGVGERDVKKVREEQTIEGRKYKMFLNSINNKMRNCH